MNLRERVDPTELNQECQRCGFEGEAVLSEAGPHIKASCPQCGYYIKFVRQRLSPEERAYWDARKGR